MSRQAGYEAGWLEAGRLEPWEPWLHWYCTREAVGVLASLVLCWGGCGSPGFTGTALGRLWGPGFTGTALGGCGSPGFTGTALGGYGSPGFTGTALGGCGSPGFTGTAVGGCGSPGFTGTALGSCESPGFAGATLGRLWEPLDFLVVLTSLSNKSNHLEISFWSFLCVPIVAIT